MGLVTREKAAAPTSAGQSHLPTFSKPVSPQNLPEEPLVVIEPSRSRVPLNLRDLWAHRELVYFLTWRDLKIRYKQTVFGAAWVILQPLLTTIVFTVFLGRLARVPSDGVPYPLFAYAGLLPWTFFSYAVGSSSNSIIGNSNLITKVYFPRIIIPVAAVAARIVDFAVAFVILAGLLIYYKVALTINIVMFPVLVMLTTLLALGVGMWVSALNVRYRDVGVVLPVALQLWMFVSPIVYPSSLVPAGWQRLYNLNPLVGIVEGFRASVFGQSFNWPALAVSTVITLVALIYSAYAFRRMEKSFADIV
ncbi:MAG: ABC transporter permease [Pyrinomonadaceae bacterium]